MKRALRSLKVTFELPTGINQASENRGVSTINALCAPSFIQIVEENPNLSLGTQVVHEVTPKAFEVMFVQKFGHFLGAKLTIRLAARPKVLDEMLG